MNRYEASKKRVLSPVAITMLVILLIVLAFVGYKRIESRNRSEIQIIDLPVKQKAEKLTSNRGNKIIERLDHATKVEKTTAVPVINLLLESEKGLLYSQELPSLEKSDGAIRSAVNAVSKSLTGWFNVNQTIRRYIVIINDMSQKQIIYKHRRFLMMSKKMLVKQDSQGLYLTAESYKRYDLLSQAIEDIDVQHGLALYLRFKSLFEQVYDEFNYPKAYQLDDIFIKAAASVLNAPVIHRKIALVPHGDRYKFAEKKLEDLDDVKKLMLRMGPENTQKIQFKLRQMIEVFSAIQQ